MPLHNYRDMYMLYRALKELSSASLEGHLAASTPAAKAVAAAASDEDAPLLPSAF